MNNRIIKFRIYNNKTKSWIHGPSDRNDLDGVNLLGETILLGGFLDGISIKDLNEIMVLQFTGLQDKNGRDIFEGDIVKIPTSSLFRKDACEVRYIGNRFVPDDMTDSVVEVIGNIFENPELLS